MPNSIVYSDTTSFDRLKSLVEESAGVIVTCHMNSDFDCVGAQYGIYRLAVQFGKPCFILVDRAKTLAESAYNAIERFEGSGIFVSPDQAAEKCLPGYLCVSVDTNRPSLVEAPQIWDRFTHHAVIDHHIRYNPSLGTDVFIGGSSYSSCGEIMSILLPYLQTPPSELLCNLLLAGIMLDTHFFTQKTTVQTFHVASALMESGANIQFAYNLFDTDHADYISRAKIVAKAQLRDGYAISVVSWKCPNVRTVAPQAADEMLTLRGIKATFVLYRVDGVLHISARGDADYDVAEIMEKMGGGGNRTMAGAQITTLTTKHTIHKLQKAIAEYTREHPEAVPQ